MRAKRSALSQQVTTKHIQTDAHKDIANTRQVDIYQKTYIESIQKHLRQLLQTVPTSKMLQVPLCLDTLCEHFKQSANKPSLRCQSKSYNSPPWFNY